MNAPDLSALVSARLCHDLISPMGAIGNGLELMQLSQTAGSAELDLISGSLGSALAKLRFYRLAFGPADSQARQSLDEARSVTDAMFQGRFTVSWRTDWKDMPRTMGRLTFLTLLCLERSLPMGGSALIAIGDDGIGIGVEGKRTAPPAALWALVTDGAPAPELRSDGVQFALLHRALIEAGQHIDAAFSDTGAKIRIAAEAPTPV
jgi:histidine phosphotransferase ChpT